MPCRQAQLFLQRLVKGCCPGHKSGPAGGNAVSRRSYIDMGQGDDGIYRSYRIVIRNSGEQEMGSAPADDIDSPFPGSEQSRDKSDMRWPVFCRLFINSTVSGAIFFTLSGSWTTSHCTGWLLPPDAA